MRSADATVRAADECSDTFGAILTARLGDYVELTKPKIAVMAAVTVVVGYVIGGAGSWSGSAMWHAVCGILLVAVSTSAWNQFLERRTDARMDRTRNRPLPAGRLSPLEVAAFGTVTALAGLAVLFAWVNPLTAWLALATLLLYVGVYTPLKRRTSACTLIGAIPGAMPPVLGYVAASGRVDAGAWVLFGILFLWQFPHFFAIGWLYRAQYEGAGLRMLPGRGRSATVGLMAVSYALVLVPVSLLPERVGLSGSVYGGVALALGVAYALLSIHFARERSITSAKLLLRGSLFYLPLLLLTLTWNHLALLQ